MQKPFIRLSDREVEGFALRGGEGRALICSALLDDEKKGAFTLAARIALDPGASVGLHRHERDEEVYAILSGEGILSYGKGECPVGPGDLFVTRKGMSHGLRNIGKEPLIFFAIVAQ